MGNPERAVQAVDNADESFELLPWDSAVFGFGVARIRDTVRTSESFADVLRALRAAGVQLAYFACSWEDAEARAIAAHHGATLVDRKVTYVAEARDITADVARDVSVERYAAREPDDALIRLARQSGEYSRFRTDPRVGPRVFEHIYDAWIRNSVTGDIADAVIIARVDDMMAGMVTVGERSRRGDIGLLAVDDRARRRGVGRALVAAARDWTTSRGLSVAQVVTQGENAPACALYETCGYTVERTVAVHHCWL